MVAARARPRVWHRVRPARRTAPPAAAQVAVPLPRAAACAARPRDFGVGRVREPGNGGRRPPPAASVPEAPVSAQVATAPVVIIGAGCIGSATAYHPGRLGIRGAVVLEKEPFAGAGSTSKAAGGVRAQFSSPINVRSEEHTS